MTDPLLVEAFNDCLEAVAAGASVDEALRRYPQFAADLRPMLEAGALVQRQLPPPGEVNYARERVRARVEAAAARRRRPAPFAFQRLAQIAAALALVALAGLGMGVAAQPAIPGDPLYGFKRLTETLALAISSSPELPQTFAARRVSEIEELLARQRPADVVFTGILQAASGSDWLVAGLPLRVPPGTPGANEPRPGDRVEVSGFTSAAGILTAAAIRLLERDAEPPLVPTVTPTTTPSATPSPTPTPTLTVTPSPTPSALSTATPSPTPLPTTASTRLPTATSSPAAGAACTPEQPDGWVSRRVRVGETLSGLAAATGTTVSELMRVNCIEDAARIAINQQLFLPRQPAGSAAVETPGQDDHDDDHDDDDDDHDNDDDDDDDDDAQTG